ncbi:MAG: hypothetical protein JW709_06370 [Sedimentisphaerales bacterium]|nr:hypothetical protein [Sedimentisphaerales bacterium]
MEKLKAGNGLIVRQKKEWGEILTGFETRNKYTVMDTDGNELYYAAEIGGNFLLRWFLTAFRPFTIQVVNPDNSMVMRIQRPFRFFFHEADIYDANDRLLGTIKRRFSVLRRIYSVYNAHGEECFELFGPILHPWTFQIRHQGAAYGKITKKWSGLLKEAFTDADNFGVTYPAEWDIQTKAVFLGAVFLIDFVHFESKNNN